MAIIVLQKLFFLHKFLTTMRPVHFSYIVQDLEKPDDPHMLSDPSYPALFYVAKNIWTFFSGLYNAISRLLHVFDCFFFFQKTFNNLHYLVQARGSECIGRSECIVLHFDVGMNKYRKLWLFFDLVVVN